MRRRLKVRKCPQGGMAPLLDATGYAAGSEQDAHAPRSCLLRGWRRRNTQVPLSHARERSALRVGVPSLVSMSPTLLGTETQLSYIGPRARDAAETPPGSSSVRRQGNGPAQADPPPFATSVQGTPSESRANLNTACQAPLVVSVCKVLEPWPASRCKSAQT